MIPEEFKLWIDNSTYEELLRKWRFEPAGSPWFTGEVGLYFEEVLRKKQTEISSEEHSRTSKSIGWGGV